MLLVVLMHLLQGLISNNKLDLSRLQHNVREFMNYVRSLSVMVRAVCAYCIVANVECTGTPPGDLHPQGRHHGNSYQQTFVDRRSPVRDPPSSLTIISYSLAIIPYACLLS